MVALLEQLKQRRKTLGLRQKDMLLRVGVSRQQYQRIESKGNPRLDTLELIAKGLQSELMLIPQDKLAAVKTILNSDDGHHSQRKEDNRSLDENPWKDILGSDE